MVSFFYISAFLAALGLSLESSAQVHHRNRRPAPTQVTTTTTTTTTTTRVAPRNNHHHHDHHRGHGHGRGRVHHPPVVVHQPPVVVYQPPVVVHPQPPVVVYERPARRRFAHSRDYSRHVEKTCIHGGGPRHQWIFCSTSRQTTGVYVNNNVRYYTEDGFQHRYQADEQCDYQLIDRERNVELETFSGSCDVAFDECRQKRNDLNNQVFGKPYQCGEVYYQD